MARYTDIETLKVHLNRDYLEVVESDYLDTLLSVAEDSIEMYINQPLSNFENEKGELRKPLYFAIIIHAATLYSNREAVSYGQPKPVPYTFDYLLQPFKKYT